MLAPLLRLNHALVHAEMPIHMRGLLLLAFLVGLEAASALRARDAKALVEAPDQVGAGTVSVRTWKIMGKKGRTYILSDAGVSWTMSTAAWGPPAHAGSWPG